MNALQRNKNRATARLLAEEVYEANLPNGLTLRGNVLYFECPRCGNDSEWYGSAEDFMHPDAVKACGGTQWCIP